MKTRIHNVWFNVRSSFWFVPGLMTLGAIVLALVAEEVDRAVGYDGTRFLYGGSSSGARDLLAVVAGSMITVAGVVFSITIVALSLASQQFGPRMLRNFMRDTGNQFVLGTFIATFVYCILILRQVRSGQDDEFIPGISIAIAVLLAIVSLAVLIYFIHHVAISIQVNSIIADVGRDFDKSIGRLFPDKLGEGAPEYRLTDDHRRIIERLDDEGAAVQSTGSGYVEAVDNEGLMKLAREHDVVIRLFWRPGQFVVADVDFAKVYPPEQADEALCKKLNNSLILSTTRTIEQDVEYAVDQLVEIAVRSLSTGINDPFSAINSIDRLTAGLVNLMGREIPPPYRFDEEGDGKFRVVAPSVSFAGVVDASFNAIRQNGKSSVPVLIRMLESIEILAHRASGSEQREPLLRHASMIVRAGREHFSEQLDRDDLEERYRRVLDALEAPAVA